MISLTNQQRELFDFIVGTIDRTGVCPSYDEMKDHLCLRSKSGVHGIVASLEERGYLRRLPNRARAIEVLQRLPDRAWADSDRAEKLRSKLLEKLDKEMRAPTLSIATVRQLIATTQV